MSFKRQHFKKRLTFSKTVFAKNCDVRLIIILCAVSAIVPIIKCAKLENLQIRLLINDDDLLQEKTNIHEQGSAAADAVQRDNSGEHFNLYRSELKRLSYETIHRILRDENEPSYRREDTELRYYQKRSPSYEQNHQLIKRFAPEEDIELSLTQQNLTEFFVTPQIWKRLNLVSVLDLSHNYIARLNISLLDNITSLQTLRLQNNCFTSIPVSRNSTLKTLNLNSNLIKTSPLTSNIYLRNLYLSGNLIENLSSIQFSLLKNLESLDISHNRLTNSETSFFTERMHNLKHLNLAHNQLGSIYRETFYNLLSLNTLLLSHNNISDIDYETFLALPNLQYLDLSFNNLQGKAIRALQGITGLVALNIGFNPDIGAYMQEFVASWSLKELDASGTGLCQIPAALAQSVRSLKLTHNWLKLINCGDLDSYPLLQYLDLSFSHIEHIEDDALGRLEILEILMLDHNKLLKTPFSLPVSLEHLFLQNNEIMEIPQQAFQGLNNLKTLDLSHNKLLYLPDIMLPKLQTLNLQSSEIRGINQGIIHSLPKLNDLMLEDNPIKCADLLGIAEWASTCRLRGDKEGEIEGEVEGEGGEADDDGFALQIQNLKNKFEKMHNFYEQFGLNTTTFINQTLLSYSKAPSCLKENLDALQQIQKAGRHEKETEKKLNLSPAALSKTLKEINFNKNSMTSGPLLSTAKSFVKHNNMPADVHEKNAIRKEQQQTEKQKKLKDEDVVKTITIENLPQTVAATMQQSSILNEKQQVTYTTPKTFNSIATPTDVVITTENNKMLNAAEEVQGGMGLRLVKLTLKNETKAFKNLTTNANADANVDALAVPRTQQQDETASIGNTPNKSSSNMTAEVVEAVSNNQQTKDVDQQQLKDMQYKTTFTKTFQTTKFKKWLKQDYSLKDGVKEMGHMLSKHSSSENINVPQFIKSTTISTPINIEIHATTTAPAQPPSIITFVSTATTATASLATTTMAKEFNIQQQLEQNSKHANGKGGQEEELRKRGKDVVGFEKTTSKSEINFEKEKQQHEDKTKIATTEEIKSMETENPKSMQTKITATPLTTKTTTTITTLNKRLDELTKEIPPIRTANLDMPNKELNRFTEATSSTTNSHANNILTTTNSPPFKITETSIDKPAIEGKQHELEEKTTTSSNAAIWNTFKTIDIKTEDTTTTTGSITAASSNTLLKAKDLASNYNDNDNGKQITTKNTNETSNMAAKATTISSTPNIYSSSNNNNNSITNENTNNQIAKTFNIAATSANNSFVDHPQQQREQQQQQQQQSHLLQNMMSHYRQSLQKDVSVKCTQSNSNECNSTATQTPNELGRAPTIEATLEQTTASRTSTAIPKAATIAAATAASSTTTVATTTVIHKHEPLQLLVKDRHLIGTPLLMHKGENLMVTADELILPTNNHNVEQEGHNNNNNSNSTNNINSNKKEHHDLQTNTMASDNTRKKYKHNLETSQLTHLSSATTTTNNQTQEDEHKASKSDFRKHQEDIKVLENPVGQNLDLEKIKKPNYETKTKKPSLIMKKMTIITKQHEETTHLQQPAEPLENEVHAKQFDNSHYQELKPLAENLGRKVSQMHLLKHSTVNTPINANSNNQPSANLLQQPHTFQHEHEVLIQQILQDQQAETHAKLSKSEQWSDLRKAESKESHPGLILLVSSGLFLVLLLGLMHVYRCDMPWRRHSPSHHLRPHQRQNHSLEDDSHSFLSYSEGLQKWHHSTRLEAPYNSPLHNLHVRELQKTSATEKPATFKSTVANFKPPPSSHSIALHNSRSLSQSSNTTTTSTVSASSSAILDDESFYIEMTPDSGQFARALQTELLPMELLNMAHAQQLNQQDGADDSQTSLEDECVVHFQQQQRHLPPLTSLASSSSVAASATLPCSTSSAISTTSLSVTPPVQARKFGLW